MERTDFEQASAIDVLQTAAEAYLVQSCSQYELAAIHGNRKTITKKDMDYIHDLIRGHGGR